MKTLIFLTLLGLATAVPLRCEKYYCMSKQPCGIPVPDCARGFERYARLESWMKLVHDDSFVIGMAPEVLQATEYVVDFGNQCFVTFLVQTPYEALPEDACLAANNVDNAHFLPC